MDDEELQKQIKQKLDGVWHSRAVGEVLPEIMLLIKQDREAAHLKGARRLANLLKERSKVAATWPIDDEAIDKALDIVQQLTTNSEADHA